MYDRFMLYFRYAAFRNSCGYAFVFIILYNIPGSKSMKYNKIFAVFVNIFTFYCRMKYAVTGIITATIVKMKKAVYFCL